ncbi:MAG TPA: hypothetical protein VEJ84_17900 [Acidimicrobiales bacterium]|nr:hypothetical protein [Acidimicrobiales bacterium]
MALGALTPEELRYHVYRAQIEHEDDLIGVRMGWFLAAESLLFAAYGVVLAVQHKGAIKGTVAIDHHVFTIVPIIGMLMAVFVGLGVGAALHQIESLWTEYSGSPKVSNLTQRKPSGYPLLRSPNPVGLLGALPSISLPPIILLSWAFVWKGIPGLIWSSVGVACLSSVILMLHFQLLASPGQASSTSSVESQNAVPTRGPTASVKF